jgi:hypothetical protein
VGVELGCDLADGLMVDQVELPDLADLGRGPAGFNVGRAFAELGALVDGLEPLDALKYEVL